jgi:hypothetical protein
LSHVLTKPAESSTVRRRPDRVVAAGVLIVAVATAVRVWLLDRTWFHLDDLILTNAAARDGLSLGTLSEPYFGHLMPGGRVLAWVAVQGGPYDYTLASLELAVLIAACGLAMLHLLLTLFGPRAGILVPLTYYAFSPFLVPATLWWAVGINHLPALAATCMATAGLVQHLRTGATGALVRCVVWMVVGLMFAELAALAALTLTVISLGYFAKGNLSQRIGHLWDARRPAVVSLALLGAGYVIAYWQTGAGGTLSAPVDWSRFITNATMVTVPVTAVGGTQHWFVAWAAQHETHPGEVARLLAYIVVITVVSLTALTRDRGMRAWLLPAAQLAVCTVLVTKSRSLFGPGIALDVRYFVPLSLGVALALGLGFLPVVDAVETVRIRRQHWLVDRPPVIAASLAVFVALSIASAASYPLRHVGPETPKRFYAAIERSLDQHDGSVDLVPGSVPDFVLGFPEATYSRSLAQYGDRVRVPEFVQDEFYVVDPDGQFVHPDLEPARKADTPTPAACGYPVGVERTVALDGPVFGYGWRVRVTYSSETDTSASISLGDLDTNVSMLAGKHVLEIPGDGEYDSVRFSGVDPDAGLCVSAIIVGTTKIPD